MNDAYIQSLDSSGWTTHNSIDNGANMNGYILSIVMKETQNIFPNRRIRAVDEDGRLIDIL